MKLVVTLEIGSTITKANAFELADGLLHHVGQGFAPTSVAAGDVGIGVDAALAAIRAAKLHSAEQRLKHGAAKNCAAEAAVIDICDFLFRAALLAYCDIVAISIFNFAGVMVQ